MLTALVNLPRSRCADVDSLRTFSNEALRRLRALPGVVSAGATDSIPPGGNHNDSVIIPEGHQMKPGESVISPSQVIVTPGYFETMGVTLVRGWFFDDRDAPAARSQRVAIVDEKVVRHFWPGQDPLGRRMYFPGSINDLLAVTPQTEWFTVVGVIRDVKLDAIVEPSNAVGAYYFPFAQRPGASRGITIAVKTAGDPHALANAVRAAINGVDRELPAFDTQTLDERMEKSLVSRRSPVLLSLGFGAVALLLSAIVI